MTLSDKFTGSRRPRTHGDRHRRRAYVKKKKNKSIPRTRKEKCQTAGQWLHLCAWRRPKALHACQFEWCFGPLWLGFTPRHDTTRLTFLTALCQKCQTSLCPRRLRCCRDPPNIL
jgi:hypothetical protein